MLESRIEKTLNAIALKVGATSPAPNTQNQNNETQTIVNEGVVEVGSNLSSATVNNGILEV